MTIDRDRMSELKITYFADDTSMGDTSAADCQAYRNWALQRIRNAYPHHDVAVKAKPSTRTVYTNDEDNREEIEFFCSRLWDECPWGFAQ